MARQRRSLDEHLADMATRGRNERSTTFSTPAMAPLGPSLIADDAILTEHLAEGAVTLEALDEALKETLDTLTENDRTLEGAADRLTQAETRLSDLFEDVSALPDQVANAKQEAIEAAQAYTDANAGGDVTAEDLEALRVDAQAKADEALRLAKLDAQTKATAAQTAAAGDATTKANKALADAQADAAKRAVNMAPRGDFETGTLAEIFPAATAASLARFEIAPSGAPIGNRFIRYTHGIVGDCSATMADVPVIVGRTYRFGVWARHAGGGAPTGSVGWPVQWRNASGGLNNNNWPKLFTVAEFGSKLTSEWQYLESDAIAPAGVVAALPRFYAYANGGPADMVLEFGAFNMRDVTDSLAATANAATDATTKMNNVANSKNATYYGTAAPTATAPKGSLAGDTYRRRNAAGNIIGEWEWVITNNVGAWVQRKMTSESMTAVDVGVLTAGSAVIQDAVAQKIAAGTAAIQKADIGNLTVTGTSNLADTVARTIAANTGKFMSLTTDQLVAGSAVMDQAIVNKLYTDVVQSREIVADRVKAGAVDGQRIVGASIETSNKPNDGVKLSDAGLVAYGKTTRIEVTYPGVPPVPVTYTNRARLTQIKNQYAGEGEPDDVWPGMWFEAERQDGLGQPVPKWKSGVTVTDPGALGVEIKSSRQTDTSNNSAVRVEPGGVGLHSWGAIGDADMVIIPGTVNLSTFGADGEATGKFEVGPSGVSVSHGGRAAPGRIPMGVIDHWVATSAITISKNTPILTRTVTVPPRSNCEMRVILRGYPTTNAQYMQCSATADGVVFGDNTHYSPGAAYGTDCRVSFMFKHTGVTEKAVTFRLTGNIAIPASASTYHMPAPTTPTPTCEVYFVDMGNF